MANSIDHVALLVEDLEAVLPRFAGLASETGEIQEFPSEGTREVYLGSIERSARLLLMQPIGARGPYARALRKRGPGLHHIGIRVPDIETSLGGFPGWLVHPKSLFDWEESRTVWLARPGVGALLELSEGAPVPGAALVERAEVPAGPATEDLLAVSVGGRPLDGLRPSEDDAGWLTIRGQRVSIGRLVGG